MSESRIMIIFTDISGTKKNVSEVISISLRNFTRFMKTITSVSHVATTACTEMFHSRCFVH